MRTGLTVWASLVLAPLPLAGADFQRLDGHGGPVMDVAVNGETALTASFDYSVGLWSLEDGAPRWLEAHRAAVNTVLYLGEDRAASGGDDFNVVLWDLPSGAHKVLSGHQGKVMALAASGDLLASASWDGTIRLWDAATGAERGVLAGHDGNVNDIAFAQGGDVLYSASYDGTVRRWQIATGENEIIVRHGFGVNRLVLNEASGWLAYGALDGGTRAMDLKSGQELADLTAGRRPILALALRPDGGQLAVGDGEGYIMIVDTADWSVVRDFRAAVRGPIWALDYSADGTRVFAGGIDDAVFAWPLDGETPELRMGGEERKFLAAPETMTNGERQFARKCSICHTLTPDTARRAGPSLFGLFGRQAGTLPGYSYSDALKSSDLVWEADTIDKLFELGPDHYTPGSKMPMQRIARPEDRADLIAFLREMTRETAQ